MISALALIGGDDGRSAAAARRRCNTRAAADAIGPKISAFE
jgi:hypothetical protein